MIPVKLPQVGDRVSLKLDFPVNGGVVKAGTTGKITVANSWTVEMTLDTPLEIDKSAKVESIWWRPNVNDVKEGSNILYALLEKVNEMLEFAGGQQ